MLYCAGTDATRWKVLNHRGQVPFVAPTGDGYTLDHAFRLRLMLDLIGGEADGLGGLAPSDAAPLVAEVMGRFPRHPLCQIEPGDWWAGVAILESTDAEGEPRRWAVTYAGELAQFAAWLEQERTFEARGPVPGLSGRGRHPAVRVFLANATRAADGVRSRAEEIGIDPFADGDADG
jgi:hypothetical protein